MLIESYSVIAKPNVDRENSRLNNVVVMTTEFNLNNNATFSVINQEEIVSLGNSEKVYCYLGHAKKGFSSNDRLPFRLGYFADFRIEGTKVKADLILSPTIESNPVLLARFPAGIKEYIFALAENEANECGFSMSVGMLYNDNDTVTVGALYSVDLVEDPALTVALFSKAPVFEDVSPILVESFSQFNYLDDAIKQGKPTEDIISSLLEALKALNIESIKDLGEVEPTETETPSETELEPVLEVSAAEEVVEVAQVEEAPVEAPTAEIEAEVVAAPVDDIRAEFAEIKAMFKDMQEMLASRFSVEEKKEEPKKVTLTFNSPMPIESNLSMTKEEHREEYNRLRLDNKVEAAKYFQKHLM